VITTTYLGSGDVSRHRRDYRPEWLDNLADHVTMEGSVLTGIAEGPEAVRAILGVARTLYDYQEFNFVGSYGDHGFVEDYTSVVRSERIGSVVVVRFNEAGQAARIVVNHRPLARCCSGRNSWASTSPALVTRSTSSATTRRWRCTRRSGHHEWHRRPVLRGTRLWHGAGPRGEALQRRAAPVVAAHTHIYDPKTMLLVDPPITSSRRAAFGDWIAGHHSVRGFIYPDSLARGAMARHRAGCSGGPRRRGSWFGRPPCRFPRLAHVRAGSGIRRFAAFSPLRGPRGTSQPRGCLDGGFGEVVCGSTRGASRARSWRR
jgi:hypothetical protein